MYQLRIQETYRKITILHHIGTDGTLWGTSGRRILRKAPNKDWEEVASFPFAAPRDYFAFARPAARAMRSDKSNLYVNQQGKIIGIRAMTVYAIEAHQPPKPLFAINGDSVLHGGMCEDKQGWSYFGEYFMNPARQSVHIWRLAPDLEGWEPAHIFPAGSIRHIHGIYRDPYDDEALWVPTGDFENECYFYRSDNRFKTLERFGDGTQMWRAVRLFFTPEHICWLTDSNLSQNYACRMRRSDGQLEIGQEIDASSWYGAETKDGRFIAFTTVELGPGIHTDRASVLASKDAFDWEIAHTFKKDFWRPMKVFKYGVISCPSGQMSSDEFYISGEGLSDLDGRSMKVSIQEI